MINLKQLQIPVGRSAGIGKVPFKEDVVQWTKSNGIDKIGSRSNEEQVGGWYFDGDGTRYVDLLNTIDLGASHVIEFEAILNTNAEILIGEPTLTNFIASVSGGIRYWLNGNSIDLQTTIDGNSHKYRIVRDGSLLELYVDDSSIPVDTENVSATDEFYYSQLFAYEFGLLAFTGDMYSFNIDGYETYFESGNQSTEVILHNNTTNDYIVGEIQNATGSDRVQDLTIYSDMDMRGYTEATTGMYFDALATEPIPDGYKLARLGTTGKVTAYDADGELIDLVEVGELKADLVFDGSGNVTQKHTKYSVFTADQLKTDNYWYQSDGTPLVRPIADIPNVQDYREFVKKDLWEQVLYNRALTNVYPDSEIVEIGKYLKLNETAIDSEGNLAVDENGVVGYSWKSTTTGV